MSGNGGDNAHNNAFGGGGRGPTGGVNGTSGKGGPTGNGPGGRLPSGGINGSGNGANVGHGGSMTVDLGNGITATFDGVHALEPGKDSGVPWGGNNGNGGNNNGGGNASSGTQFITVDVSAPKEKGIFPSLFFYSVQVCCFTHFLYYPGYSCVVPL